MCSTGTHIFISTHAMFLGWNNVGCSEFYLYMDRNSCGALFSRGHAVFGLSSHAAMVFRRTWSKYSVKTPWNKNNLSFITFSPCLLTLMLSLLKIKVLFLAGTFKIHEKNSIAQKRGVRCFIVCDNIVIVVILICELALLRMSLILQKYKRKFKRIWASFTNRTYYRKVGVCKTWNLSVWTRVVATLKSHVWSQLVYASFFSSTFFFWPDLAHSIMNLVENCRVT